jgi:hypothetical protein
MNLNVALWEQTRKQLELHDVVINDKFIFIQIPKTGSTSVVTELKNINLTKFIKCFRHEGIRYIQHLYQNKNLPVYAIVRNPYRQVLSYFFHRINYGEIFVDKNNIIWEFRKWCRESELSKNIHLLQNKYLETNNQIVKEKIKVFKFEDGIDFFIDYLNMHHDLNLDTNIHTNVNKVTEYKNILFLDFFDEATINIIKRDLKNQFELFQYSTDIKKA